MIGYISMTTPAIMFKIPESSFHFPYFVNISALITARIPSASQKMARSCINRMVVAIGSYKRNIPITIAIMHS